MIDRASQVALGTGRLVNQVYVSMSYPRTVRQLARIMLAGTWRPPSIMKRIESALGESQSWISTLVEELSVTLPGPLSPKFEILRQALQSDKMLYKLWRKTPFKFSKSILTPVPMTGIGVAKDWQIRRLTTDADLCEWLDIGLAHLDWFTSAVYRRPEQESSTLRHYYYVWIKKRSVGWRLLEVPKSKLKIIQRRILSDILNGIPAHPNSYGFFKGGSIARFVAPHIAQPIVLRMDLRDFFTSVHASKIHALFRTIGYSERIARTLTSFCTHASPLKWSLADCNSNRLTALQTDKLRLPHLPQGAPTSPALANLCSFRLDMRLTALAKKYKLSYTRYADDLLFSGRSMGKALRRQFPIWVGAIALEEHFEVNTRKTRIMKQSMRQHAAGLTINKKPNIDRKQFDLLKAILTNCVRTRPEHQNRSGHPNFKSFLQGKISYVTSVNPAKGERLENIFSKIVWTDTAAN